MPGIKFRKEQRVSTATGWSEEDENAVALFPGRERKTTFLARVTETVSYKINFHGHGGIIARGGEKQREKRR